MKAKRHFAELSGLPVVVSADGTLTITRKFLQGMTRYAEAWPGPVIAALHPTSLPTGALDPVQVRPGDLPFELRAVPYDSRELRALAASCGFVHWGPQHQLHDLGGVLTQAGVANAYCTENSLRTRRQMIDATVRNPIRRLRRYAWEWAQERKIRRNISRATGLEANGTPTYEAYRELNPRNHLFFDTRTTAAHLVDEEILERRLRRALDVSRPLHLVFSGRLAEIKGVLDLIDLSVELLKMGVSFRLTICGGGELEGKMRDRISREGLGNRVAMTGVLPFEEKLVPFVREEADVFVCAHKQGDPSCTYLETFACGVPIAGYLNEAFDGLLRRVNAGWGVPLHDVRALAARVRDLDRDRASLAAPSRAARQFAADNTFERTFDRRMAFFRSLAEES